jgi:hypothetical protein
MKQYFFYLLPIILIQAHDGTMTRPGIPVQLPQILNHPSSQRIQVNVSHEFQQVRILLANNRFVTILEEVATPLMSLIEINGMPGQQTLHDPA